MPALIDEGIPLASIDQFVITSTGLIKERTGNAYPLLTVQTDPVVPGDILRSPEITTSLRLIENLQKNGIAVGSISIYTTEYCVVELPVKADTIRVLYNSQSDTVSLVSTLQGILTMVTIEDTKPVEIDFRFDKPILRY
jgi:hypothetical protein